MGASTASLVPAARIPRSPAGGAAERWSAEVPGSTVEAAAPGAAPAAEAPGPFPHGPAHLAQPFSPPPLPRPASGGVADAEARGEEHAMRRIDALADRLLSMHRRGAEVTAAAGGRIAAGEPPSPQRLPLTGAPLPEPPGSDPLVRRAPTGWPQRQPGGTARAPEPPLPLSAPVPALLEPDDATELPGLDPDRLAALVNDALVEQARRNGVDLS
jgi:hypothetical protein